MQYPKNYSIYNPGGFFGYPTSISASINVDQCSVSNGISTGATYSTGSFNTSL